MASSWLLNTPYQHWWETASLPGAGLPEQNLLADPMGLFDKWCVHQWPTMCLLQARISPLPFLLYLLCYARAVSLTQNLD